jgi:GNAT superfamily N-acetyltransferase
MIRVARPDDTAVALEVFNAAFAPLRSIYRPIGEVAARQGERAKEGTRLVAEIERCIVGTVQFAVHEKHVHIIGLAVHPDFQGIGVARCLIKWVVARTPGLGHNIVAVDTIKETGNVAFFEKIGFHVVHENVATWCESDESVRQGGSY